MASDPSSSREVGNRTSNVSSDVNMGCFDATSGSKSSDDLGRKRSMLRGHWMFRVDAHHHLWVSDQPWVVGEAMAPLRRAFTVEDLARAARGIDATVLVQSVTGDTPELLALAGSTELIAGVVGWADLTAEDLALDGEWLVGIRHQVQDEP